MRGIVAALALALAALASPAVAADDLPQGGMTAPEVVDWLKAAGYAGKITEEGARPRIEVTTQKETFRVTLYDCQKDGRCAAMQFAQDIDRPLSAERANQWNIRKRYAKLQLEDGGQASLRYDANLSPGGTYDALYDDLNVWLMMLNELKTFVSKDPNA